MASRQKNKVQVSQGREEGGKKAEGGGSVCLMPSSTLPLCMRSTQHVPAHLSASVPPPAYRLASGSAGSPGEAPAPKTRKRKVSAGDGGPTKQAKSQHDERDAAAAALASMAAQPESPGTDGAGAANVDDDALAVDALNEAVAGSTANLTQTIAALLKVAVESKFPWVSLARVLKPDAVPADGMLAVAGRLAELLKVRGSCPASHPPPLFVRPAHKTPFDLRRLLPLLFSASATALIHKERSIPVLPEDSNAVCVSTSRCRLSSWW